MAQQAQAALVPDPPNLPDKPERGSKPLQIRLDRGTNALLEDYALKHNLTRSMAARMMLFMALQREAEGDPAFAFNDAAYKEGLYAGLRTLKKGMAALIDSAFSQVPAKLDE